MEKLAEDGWLEDHSETRQEIMDWTKVMAQRMVNRECTGKILRYEKKTNVYTELGSKEKLGVFSQADGLSE